MDKIEGGALLDKLGNILSDIFKKSVEGIFKGEDGLIESDDISQDVFKTSNGIYGITLKIPQIYPTKDKKENTLVGNIIEYLSPAVDSEDADEFKSSADVSNKLLKRLQNDDSMWDVKFEWVAGNGVKDGEYSKTNLKGFNTEVKKELKTFTSKIKNKVNKIIKQIDAERVQSAQASKHISLTLEKITSSDSIDIELQNVSANYSILELKDDIDNIVNNDNFINELPENTPTNYIVDVLDDEYDINVADDKVDSCCNDAAICNQLFIQAVNTCCKIKQFKWSARGEHMEMIHNISESVGYSLDFMIDTLATHILQFTTETPCIQVDICNSIDCLSSNQLLPELKKELESLITSIDYVVDYLDDSIQGCIKDYRNTFNNHCNQIDRYLL